jgi:hypothetical protein
MDTLVRENALDTLYHCVDPGFRIFERPSKLYLLVTHYNSIQYLQKCLTSIFEQEVSIPLQVSLVDDRLTITGKWQATNKLPILSTTLIEKKFKKLD